MKLKRNKTSSKARQGLSPSMEKAIQDVYQVFSKYKVPQQLNGCPCCTDPETLRMLTVTRRQNLQECDLSEYAFKAMTTIGMQEDYKYFLPRLFEMYAELPSNHLDFYTLEYKLTFAKWSNWPNEEYRSVYVYLVELFKYGIECGKWNEFNEVLEVVLTLIGFPQELSDYWMEHLNENGWELWCNAYQDIFSGYHPTLESIPEIKNWFQSKEFTSRLETAFFETTDSNPELAERISTCHFILENTLNQITKEPSNRATEELRKKELFS